MAFFGLFADRAQATPEADFWKWFQRNDAVLFDFERDQEKIFDRLANEMHKVHPSLTFEFGPIQNGQREFVISADGIRDAFPKVEALYAAAPKLARWKIIKFRPRREPFDIGYGGISVKADSVVAQVIPDGQKAGIIVFIPGYSPSSRDTYMGIAFLMLDQALGEYDVETRVGVIEVKEKAQAPAKAITLHQLPDVFDAYFAKQ